MFVVNNGEYFTENSELYNIKTRNNRNLFQAQSNLSISQRGPRYAGNKIYSNLPTQICSQVILISLKKFLRISYSYVHFIL